MEGLAVRSWENWEMLCAHLMSERVRLRTGCNVAYGLYGGRGQVQHGIDLVPYRPTPPVAMVAQCKLRTQKPLTWNDIVDDLVKTESYPGPITHYVVFTTAAKHVSIQDVMMRGPYVHRRSDQNTFEVAIVYWEDISIEHLNGVPANVLERIFPDAKRLFEPPAPASSGVSPQFLPSLTTLRAFFPSVFSCDWLRWLEEWDFSQGYVPNAIYGPMSDLAVEIHRVRLAMTGMPNVLYRGDRAALAACLPAGDELFAALTMFCDTINERTVGSNLADGADVQSLVGIPASGWPSITAEWCRVARQLASVYRTDVLGEHAD